MTARLNGEQFWKSGPCEGMMLQAVSRRTIGYEHTISDTWRVRWLATCAMQVQCRAFYMPFFTVEPGKIRLAGGSVRYAAPW